MYQVAKNNKKYAPVYHSYESARQAVRKMLRKKTEIRINNQPFTFLAGNGINTFGYKIIKVV